MCACVYRCLLCLRNDVYSTESLYVSVSCVVGLDDFHSELSSPKPINLIKAIFFMGFAIVEIHHITL